LNNLKSEAFNWQVPVESVPLPSKGLIYNEASWFHMKEMIDIKSMTANEEDILASQAYIKKGIVVDELIKSCVMDKNADPKDLLIGDKNALAIAIRITGYGSSYDCSVYCTNCQHKNEKIFDLSSLGIKQIGATPVKDGTNCFEFTLPVSKKKVYFKMMTVRDSEFIEANISNRRNMLGELSIGTITSNLENQVIAIDGVEDRKLIKEFIAIMPAFDSKSLRGYMSKIQPGIDMNVNFDCDNCSAKNIVSLPMNANFFWPPAIT
jgi:hypothetical protein